jgi:AraC-like DNA-binding protein
MADLIRSTALSNYAEVARANGLVPAKMLKKARLPPDCLGRSDLRIPVKAVRRLIEISAEESGVESFGLQMARSGSMANLGPLAFLIQEQATIGTALDTLARFIHIHNEGMRLIIERRKRVVIIALVMHGGALRQATEVALGTADRTIRTLLGGDWQPLEVHFMHSAPRTLRHHREFFGCDLVFDSDFDGIVCNALDLDRQIPTALPDLARYAEGQVQAMDTRNQAWDARVAEAVRALFPSQDCTIERVAEHFSCTRRTIHRHLADCGTTFSEILDNQRADLALRLIQDRSRPLSQIAEMVGFSAQSAMARWFRGRFGCSVTEWRTDPREGLRAVAGRW